jgi:thiamine biosynthesis protein ThiS
MEMNSSPSITLNGQSHAIEGTITLVRLLESIGLADKPVVVELNEQAIFPRDYAATSVENGARIEIVTLAAGG